MLARPGPCESAPECRKSAHFPTYELQLGQRVLVLERVDELHLAVLANLDAVLRRLDSAATP